MLLGLLSGCGSAAQESDGLSVVAVNFACYDLAKQIVGENGTVTMLIPAGTESHTYEPTTKDILSIQQCGLFVYVGGESESWVDDVLNSVGDGVRTVRLMDCVEVVEEETVEGMEDAGGSSDEPEYDEHVWTSPMNAIDICERICAALCETDPDNSKSYEQNFSVYRGDLLELDAAFRDAVDNGVRKTVVFADRFPLRYFADEYGLEYFAAWPGCADESEPSAATVAFLIDKVNDENIPVVFHIELSNEDMADTICEATGAKKLQFNACHNVTADQFKSGVTYLDLMWENVEVLKEALG